MNQQGRRFLQIPSDVLSNDQTVEQWAAHIWDAFTGYTARSTATTVTGAHMNRNFYSDAFIDALQFTAMLHRNQERKGTSIPYVSHLMAVAGIVLEAGGDKEQAIAGLLHDAVEDQGGEPTRLLIQERFGPEVARIVAACSDASPAEGEKKAPWRQRKEHHINALEHEDERVLLVTVADKIHNGESILHDLDASGPQVWSRFNASPADIAWYYLSVLQVAQHHLHNVYAVGRLSRLATALAAAAVDPEAAQRWRNRERT